MGPLGWPEIIIILVVLLLLFGAKRLPEMGRSLGRGMREFKDSVSGDHDDHNDDATHVPPEQAEIGPAPTTDISEPQPRERDTVV